MKTFQDDIARWEVLCLFRDFTIRRELFNIKVWNINTSKLNINDRDKILKTLLKKT